MDLYRFFDADDDLLYVGISLHAARRASEHRADKPWWPEVARMEVEHLGDRSRSDAEQYERSAILAESPRYNVRHAARLAAEPALLEWLCEACLAPIADGAGYLELPNAERTRYRSEMSEHRSEHPDHYVRGDWEPIDWTALFALPDRAHWWALHRKCDPDPDKGGYWIEIARIRTAFDVIQWSAHLLGKPWINDTDWTSLLGRIAGPTICTRSSDTTKEAA